MEIEESNNNNNDLDNNPDNNDLDNILKNYEILREDFPNNDLLFKIIIIGNSGVGKSCLSMQATRKCFDTNYLATVGFEFFVFNIKLDSKVIKLQIWDTCGQEVYRSLITSFYKNSSLAIIVYAINDEKSFNDIDLWIKDLKTNSSPDIKIFLIGNKSDLEEERKIDKEQALKIKKDFEFDLFMETSAKTGFNAQNLFVQAAQLLYKNYINHKLKSKKLENHKVKFDKKHKKGNNCC